MRPYGVSVSAQTFDSSGSSAASVHTMPSSPAPVATADASANTAAVNHFNPSSFVFIVLLL